MSRFDLVTNEISSFCNIPQEACARAFRVLIYQEYHYDKYRTMNKKCVYQKNVNSDIKELIFYSIRFSYTEGIKHTYIICRFILLYSYKKDNSYSGIL